MITIYLKDSVLTTHSIKFIEDLKPKVKKGKKYLFPKNVSFLHLVSRNPIESNLFLKKELSRFSAALNRQNMKAVFFSSGRLLNPPSPVLPICLRIARARPTKILKAITFQKQFGF